ncbi:hypothetical protein J9303_15295 [Bacillaceae bacterium Marseille-Q3522]|nr:hypothetical protein [Bacillaceae bacterium Marseille-Q3522]
MLKVSELRGLRDVHGVGAKIHREFCLLAGLPVNFFFEMHEWVCGFIGFV